MTRAAVILTVALGALWVHASPARRLFCPACHRGRHRCPSRMYPEHLTRGPCDTWLHDNGAHACTTLGWRRL